MDEEKEIVKQILESYDLISGVREDDGKILFSLKDKEYIFGYTSKDSPTDKPSIWVKNDERFNYPHIIPFEFSSNKDEKYRVICLHETNSVINFMSTYEDKIFDTIDRLIELVSLSPKQVEKEFQKELLYYWNNMATNTYAVKIFLKEDESFKRLNSYYDKKGNTRIVENGIRLNDALTTENGVKIWNHNSELPAFYIPIINNQGILPPTKDNVWTGKEICMIIYGNDCDRISHETYLQLQKEKIKNRNAVLVFGMSVEGNDIFFTSIVKFKNTNSTNLFDKLIDNIESVQIINSKRMDFHYLCKQIGNDVSVIDKKVLLVGAGSLGSYVAKEIVKAGMRNLTIYDYDTIEEENLLRHRVNGFWVGAYKVNAIKRELEALHSEIYIKVVEDNIDGDSLREKMLQSDLVIFTVGNSDLQLMANRVFMKENYDKPVIYTWLEAGGTDSHILSVDYGKPGCFECLFTDEKGGIINNKANVVSDDIVENSTVRNGCGATRVKYGTSILLRTTSVLLDVIKNVFDGQMKENSLFDITPISVINSGNSFVEGKCGCCGNRNR